MVDKVESAETKATETKTEDVGKHTSLTSTQDLPDGSIAVTQSSEETQSKIGTWFDDEVAPSEEELSDIGVIEDKSNKLLEEKKTESLPPEDKKVEEKVTKTTETKTEEKAKEKVEEKVEEKKEGDGVKPLPGFVPLAALHEERRTRQALTTEVEGLRGEIETLKLSKKTGEDRVTEDKTEDSTISDFTTKVADIKKKVEDDPVEASRQTLDLLEDLPKILQKVQEGVKKELNAGQEEKKSEEEFNKVVAQGMGLMEKLIPGISTPETSDVNKTLSTFAEVNGLPVSLLNLFTHPGTLIMGKDGRARYLGEDAAYFAHFLSRTHEISGNGEITKEMENEVLKKNKDEWTKTIREEETAKLIKKFKGGLTKENVHSIGDLPGDTGETEDELFSGAILSEVQFARLSSDQQKKYLME